MRPPRGCASDTLVTLRRYRRTSMARLSWMCAEKRFGTAKKGGKTGLFGRLFPQYGGCETGVFLIK